MVKIQEMTETDKDEPMFITKETVEAANNRLIEYMHRTLDDASLEIDALRLKLSWTYWIIVVLSIIMFLIGIALLSVPVMAAYRGGVSEMQSVISAGFGITNLVALFFFRPTQRLHQLMGDVGQITVILNSFQTQVALRLLEADSSDRDSMGEAAEYVGQTAEFHMKMIQSYFEEDTLPKSQASSTIPRPMQDN